RPARRSGLSAASLADRMTGGVPLLPGAVRHANVIGEAFDRRHGLPSELAAILRETVTVRTRGIDVGVRIILRRPEHDCAQRAQSDVRDPTAIVANALAATPNRIVAAGNVGSAGVAQRELAEPAFCSGARWLNRASLKLRPRRRDRIV